MVYAVKVTPLDNYNIIVEFNTGEIKIYNKSSFARCCNKFYHKNGLRRMKTSKSGGDNVVFEKNIEKINPIKRDQVVSCIKIAQRNQKIAKMIIFGSSVREDCTPNSDIDMCLVINGTTKCIEMYELARDINYACDYNCDILTYHKLNDKFKQEIERKGVVVYELS